MFNGFGLCQANPKTLSDTEVVGMAEQIERGGEPHGPHFYEYTYTYDQFTVFFYGSHVYIGGKEFPIGQSVVDVMNLDESVLDEIERRAKAFVPTARNLLTEKTDSAAALAQEKLNAVWDIIFSLPVYRDLKMDEECNYHTLQRLKADPAKWAEVQDPASEGYAMYQGMMIELVCFAERLRELRQFIAIMEKNCLEPLKRRSRETYAEAYSHFYAKVLSAGAQIFGNKFETGIPMKISFVPMFHPTEEGKIFIAEKAEFHSLMNFLQTEFYRGLVLGNAPRRCHNCGKYFLLTNGYNTCYCNNIAPGETERTCRKVGAHKKESMGKENRTPTQKEYDRTYNRLKVRKQRGKISTDEWNVAVAKAQELVAQSERGELTDEELRERLGRL